MNLTFTLLFILMGSLLIGLAIEAIRPAPIVAWTLFIMTPLIIASAIYMIWNT